MKNIKKLIVATSLFIGSLAFAQAPEKMSYQAVVRNTTNNLVTNQAVGMKISILQGTATGTAVYVETQTPTSNANGLVSLEIGGGSVVSGNMATINWANGPYFIKTETDPTGGTNYTITGTSQLLSTPYALYAKTSGSSTPGPAGTNGVDGKTVLNGTSNPTAAIGANGDFFINTSSNTLFGPKAAGAWPTGVSLVGPAGSNATVTGSAPIAVNAGVVSLSDSGVTSAKLADASVTMAKINQATATSGQVIKWNGTAWAPAADNDNTAAITNLEGQINAANAAQDTQINQIINVNNTQNTQISAINTLNTTQSTQITQLQNANTVQDQNLANQLDQINNTNTNQSNQITQLQNANTVQDQNLANQLNQINTLNTNQSTQISQLQNSINNPTVTNTISGNSFTTTVNGTTSNPITLPAGSNGTNGLNGYNSLVKSTAETAGANCATGGVKLEFGLDANSNGSLEAGEVTPALTRYVCNGATGASGNNGATGATGAAGQGVPTGGTANQVLAKVDGVNFNTQWVTPASGSTLLVQATANTAQTFSVGGNSVVPDVATCFNNVTINVGSVYNNTSGIFTAPTSGLYLISVQVVSSNLPTTSLCPMIDVNNDFTASGGFENDFFGVSLASSNFRTGTQNRGQLTTQVFLTAGQIFSIRFQNPTSASTIQNTISGSTNLIITKL